MAKNLGAPLGVITFEPHPRRFFQPAAEPFRLTLPPMKERLLKGLGVDHVFTLAFDRALSLLTAEDFIQDILVDRFQARHIVVGEGFAFGRQRGGTVATLNAAKKFGVTAVRPVLSPQGQVYSSSAIRNLLQQGHLAETEKLLGWRWCMEGPVVPGDQRGRTLGYPTANQNMPDYVRLPYGIYAVRARIEGEDIWHDGVANFGIRPMFRSPEPLFETFIFNFDRDIYGKSMQVQPLRHLRPELAFTGVPALIAQMKEDCIAAKAVLKSIPLP